MLRSNDTFGHPYRAVYWLQATLVAVLLLYSFSAPAETTVRGEYKLKAAFMYNFAGFTSWPSDPLDSFHFCVLGKDPFNDDLTALQNKLVHDVPLKILKITDIGESDRCQLLYVSTSLTDQAETIISRLEGKPVLTVSDIDGFTDYGGMIGLRIIDNRIRFEINADAASRAGISFSSKLLALATTVRRER